jgi:hypothetical protein
MKGARLGSLVLAAISVAAVGCSPAPARWNGNWKLDVSKSHMANSSFGVELAPSGGYTLSNGYYTYTFACDGTQYADPSRAHRTISCTELEPGHLRATYADNGKPSISAFWNLSNNNQTLTIAYFPLQAGASVPATSVYHRVWGTSGFAGEWLDDDYFSKTHQAMTLSVTGRTLHMSWPGDPQTLDLPLDGSDHSFRNGTMPGITVEGRCWRPDQIGFVHKTDGRVYMRESMTISSDGRTLIEKFWSPGHSDYTSLFTWEKQ